MTSSFGWLDHSEHQRRQMLEVVNLFREKGTLDELGIGVVRDTFANHFFPGTSTLHTRARYLLLIPWVMRVLEHKRVPSADFDRRARELQGSLVRSLKAGGEREGVIGIDAGNAILRPPSIIYWSAMRSLGILRYPYSYESYVRSIDRQLRDKRGALRSDDGELVEAGAPVWHGGLPEPPEGFLDSTTFDFSREEADYLRERIVTQQGSTLMAELVTSSAAVAGVDLPWKHPAVGNLPGRLDDDLLQAKRFSLISSGAYLQYNVMLAEAAVKAGMTARAGLPERYRERFAHWSDEMTAEAELYDGWQAQSLWETFAYFGQSIPLKTRRFVERWSTLALGDRVVLVDDAQARRLITDREHALKRGLARLQSRRALENWGGASSLFRLDYRWGNARQIIVDVKAGLRQQATEVTTDA